MLRVTCILAIQLALTISAFAQTPVPATREMNNLATELLSVEKVPEPRTELVFETPRTGWVFISLSSYSAPLNGENQPQAFLDGTQDALVWRPYPENKAIESMRFMKLGRHILRLRNSEGLRLDVRGIPELMYCYYPTHPHIAAYGPYDWTFMNRYVLPHVNVLVSRNDVPKSEFDEWLREGRHWVSNASLLGLGDEKAPELAAVLTSWAGNPGVIKAEFSGMIVDEFGDFPAQHFSVWADALKQLHAMPQFSGKTYYAWCGNLAEHKPSYPFCQTLMDLGDRFTWEVYFHEQPTLEGARKNVISTWIKEMTEWKNAFPNIAQRMVMCPGYLSAPPETLNLDPGVDYQVFMDIQFHTLATEPVFRGLYGIMEYMADYADEESLRYAHQLFRHYAIEGKTGRFNNDPYVLPHLKNGDFSKGLDAWTVEAVPGAIKADSMKDLGWLEGRYPQKVIGDTFCRFQRNGEKPNSICQTLQALQPSRLYSLKYLAADIGDLHTKQPVTLGVEIKNADCLEEYAIEYVYPSCYNHESGPYNNDHPAFFTWRRVVFQPKQDTAELSISDWRSPTDSGSPAEQQIALNFIEVQPFHE